MTGFATLLGNAAISQIDGHCAGHRVFGRAPRLPIGDNETVDFPLIMNSTLAPGRYTQMTMRCLSNIHKIYHEEKFGSKLKTVLAKKLEICLQVNYS